MTDAPEHIICRIDYDEATDGTFVNADLPLPPHHNPLNDYRYIRADVVVASEERSDARIAALVAERDAARDTGALLRRHLDDARRELQRKHERAEAAEQRERDARAEIERLRKALLGVQDDSPTSEGERRQGPPVLPLHVDEDGDVIDSNGSLVCCPAREVWGDDREHAVVICCALNAAIYNGGGHE